MLYLLRLFRSAIGLAAAFALTSTDSPADASETAIPVKTVVDGNDIESRIVSVRLRFLDQKDGTLPDINVARTDEELVAQWYNWPNWPNYWNDWSNWYNY